MEGALYDTVAAFGGGGSGTTVTASSDAIVDVSDSGLITTDTAQLADAMDSILTGGTGVTISEANNVISISAAVSATPVTASSDAIVDVSDSGLITTDDANFATEMNTVLSGGNGIDISKNGDTITLAADIDEIVTASSDAIVDVSASGVITTDDAQLATEINTILSSGNGVDISKNNNVITLSADVDEIVTASSDAIVNVSNTGQITTDDGQLATEVNTIVSGRTAIATEKSGNTVNIDLDIADEVEAQKGIENAKGMTPRRVDQYHQRSFDSDTLTGYSYITTGNPTDGQVKVASGVLTFNPNSGSDSSKAVKWAYPGVYVEASSSAGVGLTGVISTVSGPVNGIYTITLATPYNGSGNFTGAVTVLFEGFAANKRRTYTPADKSITLPKLDAGTATQDHVLKVGPNGTVVTGSVTGGSDYTLPVAAGGTLGGVIETGGDMDIDSSGAMTIKDGVVTTAKMASGVIPTVPEADQVVAAYFNNNGGGSSARIINNASTRFSDSSSGNKRIWAVPNSGTGSFDKVTNGSAVTGAQQYSCVRASTGGLYQVRMDGIGVFYCGRIDSSTNADSVASRLFGLEIGLQFAWKTTTSSTWSSWLDVRGNADHTASVNGSNQTIYDHTALRGVASNGTLEADNLGNSSNRFASFFKTKLMVNNPTNDAFYADVAPPFWGTWGIGANQIFPVTGIDYRFRFAFAAPGGAISGTNMFIQIIYGYSEIMVAKRIN